MSILVFEYVNMKPVFAPVTESIGKENIFLFKEINLPYFSTEFHFHEECQLVYVIKSQGKRIIGDSIEDFCDDEMVFLGSDIPHVWHNNKTYFETTDTDKAQSMAVFFKPAELIEALKKFSSTRQLEKFLRISQRGLVFQNGTKTKLKFLLQKARHLTGLAATINFLAILDTMAQSKTYSFLASEGYVNNLHKRDNQRMDLIIKYVLNNFYEEIPLAKIADLAGMNPHSFCRYFKNTYKKTFTHFVNEVRIGHSCKLLTEYDHTIENVAYECGFNSISNFNKFFKQIKNCTPREFRDTIRVL